MKIDIIPFKAEHVDRLDDLEGELVYLGKDYVDQIRMNETEGPGYSGVVNNTVVGCGGVRMFWGGVGEAWGIYPATAFLHHIKDVFRYTKLGLERIIVEYDLKRVQATARVNFPCAQNWLRHLGFKIEANMRNYCPSGEDTFLYSIIRN